MNEMKLMEYIFQNSMTWNKPQHWKPNFKIRRSKNAQQPALCITQDTTNKRKKYRAFSHNFIATWKFIIQHICSMWLEESRSTVCIFFLAVEKMRGTFHSLLPKRTLNLCIVKALPVGEQDKCEQNNFSTD